MTFQSIDYLGFLLLIWLVAIAANRPRWRQACLLTASYCFYFLWSPHFLLLLIAASLFNYAWGRVVRQEPSPARLWVGLTGNLGLLFFFKYSASILDLLGVGTGSEPGILVPVGISFYTFQAISYQMDTYRGYEESPSLLEFSLYLAFWPTILSGPICRMPEMLPQFRRCARPTRRDLAIGLKRIVIGLFMKVVIADTLAFGLQPGRGVVHGFDQIPGGWSSLDVLFLALGYGFQIFFDFAGYSHAAIGSARIFGIRLRENFDDPYRSLSISDFWTRWHMSLSSWIRDYLFFPTATLRPGLFWRSLALVLSMTVFGIWHGVGATFVLWGTYHGVLVAVHRLFQQRRRRYRSIPAARGRLGVFLSWSLTFALVTAGWILFRARDLSQAWSMYAAVFRFGNNDVLNPDLKILVILVFGSYFFWLAVRKWIGLLRRRPLGASLVGLASPVCLATMILLIIIWSDQSSPFVYVKF